MRLNSYLGEVINEVYLYSKYIFFLYVRRRGQPIVNAVDGVSLEIEKGEFVALLGHNGCGKSTVAKHLNAMLVPDKGKVFVDGDDTADEEKTLDIRKR